jgi:hypothetical protein
VLSNPSACSEKHLVFKSRDQSSRTPLMDHWALLMMKDPELHSLQATPLPSISRRRHHARSPETYMLGDYWYCSCAADSPPPGFIVPAPWPPEPEEPSGAWDEEKGAAA